MVFDADYLEIRDEEALEAGFLTGRKGRLLTLAARLHAEASKSPLRAKVVCLADADYDGAPPELYDFVIVTDGYSVENYAISERSTERFMMRQFGRAIPPPGSGGRRRSGGTVVSGAEFLSRLVPPSVAVTAARRVLLSRHPETGLIAGWTRRFTIDQDGWFSADVVKLLRDSVISGGESFSGEDVEALATEQANVSRDPRLLIRGRDFVALFHSLLKTPWGKRATGSNLGTVEERDFQRWLVLSAAPVEVDIQAAAGRLIERFS